MFRHQQPCKQPCLACVGRHQRVRVVTVEGGDDLAERLIDHGLWPGATVTLLTTAPLGDPLLFRLHGFRLALRRDEALRVVVEPIQGPIQGPK